MASTICTDLLALEIFPRLPFESILRFRCVCRQWGDLLSSEDFLKSLPITTTGFIFRQQPHLPSNPSSLLAHLRRTGLRLCQDGYFSLRTQRSVTLRTTSQIVASRNGLLLAIARHGDVWHVLNPLTRTLMALPSLWGFGHRGNIGAAIDYDPRVSSSDFRVFLLSADHRGNLSMQVFVSGPRRRWELIPLHRRANLRPVGNAVYAGGFLCVLFRRSAGADAALVAHHETRRIWDLALPRTPLLSPPAAGYTLCAFGDSIFLSAANWNGFGLWVLEMHPGGFPRWKSKHREDRLMIFDCYDTGFLPSIVHVEGEAIYVRVGRKKVVGYDMILKTYRTLEIERMDMGGEGWPPLIAFSPCLVGDASK